MSYEYFYIVWTIFFLAIWVILYLLREDVRHEMLVISAWFGVGGILSEKTHVIDWWQPATITGTSIGIEDFLIGFAIGGIAAVIYEELYAKRLVRKSAKKAPPPKDSFTFILAFAGLFFAGFYAVGLPSFYAALIAYVVGLIYMLPRRKDLALNSVASGILMLALGTLTYFGLFLIYPEFVATFWYLPQVWYSELVFGIPVAEYIWYFLTGAFIGPLYEFIRGYRLVNISK